MLTVSSDGRYLLKNGMFFPYLADTAWTLLQRLTREEICLYLNKRQEQGFNAVQISAVSELDGLRIPNRENQLPFKKRIPHSQMKHIFLWFILLRANAKSGIW